MDEKSERLTKLEAARRQLRTAIQLLFNDGDVAAVHTLVGAASTVISALVEQNPAYASWDKFAQEANHLAPQTYWQVMRAPQNFLKHADRDASATFELNPADTEGLAFWAVMNLGNFGELPMEESVFQLWYLACHAPDLERDIAPYERAREVFGDLRKAPRAMRLTAARRVLQEQFVDACS